ncbi:hypothetical protein MANES_08G072951v8 [Manihot esculenta]|uniref:Uncharacterized protein n=2 Tax=Manihot esculenta TaxID=3983 RepID=A0ACB7H9R8_MANES|nr:hypothetical protein MANES_08G072951v8 [Manihot esculenta]
MSWFRSAVYRAVEAGGKTKLTHKVRSYADTVVYHAGNSVVEGAKIITHRIGAGNSKDFRLTVKRLEEVSVSCRGMERIELLRRWLVALKEAERSSAAYSENYYRHLNEPIISDEAKEPPNIPTLDYYVDPDLGKMSFHNVFLYSRALEGMTLSVILEAPNEEEVSLLLEIFGLCLAGGKEVHKEVMNNIQDLASTFSSYQDEVLVRRDELLQYAQCAISGLKINADVIRIDAEVCSLMGKLDKMKTFHQLSNGAGEQSFEETEFNKAVEETLEQIELCFTLETLLLKKKSLSNGDSPELHAGKVDKLKVLSESLLNSMSKAERRIMENRFQKDEALSFRVAKASEVRQLEMVNSSLIAARARLHNVREEQEQFVHASSEIVVHLEAREDELSRSMSLYRLEADVVNAWINFLQDTWAARTTHVEQKEKQVNAELEKYGDYFVNLVIHLLMSHKEQLGPSITRVKGYLEDFHSFQRPEIAPSVKDNDTNIENQRKIIEKEYLDLEGKLLTTSRTMENVKKQFYNGSKGIYRKDDERVKELFSAIEKMKEEFDSIERPVFEVETPLQRSLSVSPRGKHTSKTVVDKHLRKVKSSLLLRRKSLILVELEELESELGKDDADYLPDEIGEWEFDGHHNELEVTKRPSSYGGAI